MKNEYSQRNFINIQEKKKNIVKNLNDLYYLCMSSVK